jgi:hypothetical protein
MTRGYASILHATWKEALERASDAKIPLAQVAVSGQLAWSRVTR